ncbi:MAG: LacI family transcriptional regulator [Tannerella sp.]|jgi:LacI family transcriptional regulator|nr:LacI family transcriptional regulator [Tannerella sp.]
MVRAKDLAKELGVSTATISLVLNGKPGISDKTRENVIQKIKELGYGYLLQSQPELADESSTLGFIIYKNNGELLGMNSFFPLILDGIELTARQHGYNLVVITIEKWEIEKQINYIRDSNCAGYVIFATEMHEEEVVYFEKLGIPFVLFDNYFVDKQINSVKVNNEQGTYTAVKYLYDKGHRTIGYLTSGLDINSFVERRNSAFAAMRQFGMENQEQYCYNIGYPHEKSEIGMTIVLTGKDKRKLPTAFLADNDLVAVGAIQAMKRLGHRIPEDFSVIGYDDRPICTLVEPRLTTIQLPRGRFGAESVEQLIRTMQKEETAFVKVEVNGILIERETVAEI